MIDVLCSYCLCDVTCDCVHVTDIQWSTSLDLPAWHVFTHSQLHDSKLCHCYLVLLLHLKCHICGLFPHISVLAF